MKQVNYYSLCRRPCETRNILKWPSEIAEKYNTWWVDSAFGFMAGSIVEEEFLTNCSALHLHVYKTTVPLWDPKCIELSPYYLVAVKDSTWGFSAQNCFENVMACDNPPPEFIEGMRVCAEGKRQIRKWQVIEAKKARKADICLSSLVEGPRLPMFENFIISRRLYEVLVREQLTGFHISPILDGNDKWTEEELSFDYRDELILGKSRWFQLTVTGRPLQPLQLSLPLVPHPNRSSQVCGVCNRNFGSIADELYWRSYPTSFFSDADLQLCNDFIEPNGARLTVAANTTLLIASARFVRAMHDERITGFLSAAKKPDMKFWPVLLEAST